MASTYCNEDRPEGADWRSAGLLFYGRNFFYRNRFGQKTWKVSVDAGLGCPNRDGTLGTEGCIFCNPESFSPARRSTPRSISEQIDEGIRHIQSRRNVEKFVAYFQPATNTYAPVERLRRLYGDAIAHPKVVGLSIGTRPDCVPDDVLDLLAELAGRTWLCVEYGLQTIHDRSLEWINRGHDYRAFLDAYRRTRRRGLEVGVHVILGLPGESPDDMLATARELARLRVDAVKLHNLHAVRNTLLAELVAKGQVRLPRFEEYVCWVVDFLEVLGPDCVIDRLSGDAPPEYLIGPKWCLDKSAVRAAVEAKFRHRGTCQGRKAATGGRDRPG